MRFKLPAKSFNAVMACAAVEDRRFYLNTFCVDIDNKRMIATNGHIMGEADLELDSAQGADLAAEHNGFRGFLFKALKKPLLKSVETVIIDTTAPRLALYVEKYRGPGFIALEPEDGKFPEYVRVSARTKSTETIAQVALNPEYLYRPAKWTHLNFPVVKIEFSGVVKGKARGGMRVTLDKLHDTVFTLMPCRW